MFVSISIDNLVDLLIGVYKVKRKHITFRVSGFVIDILSATITSNVHT